jgi:hypothetical protein
MNHPHTYFIEHLLELDSNFKHYSDENPLSEYIKSLKIRDFIETPLISLMVQSEFNHVNKLLLKPIHEVLESKFLKRFVSDDDVESRFVMSFAQDSDYSSHVRIVGTITPHFTYQVMVEELNEFEANYLFTLQLMLLTYWEASSYGSHPWVSLIEI